MPLNQQANPSCPMDIALACQSIFKAFLGQFGRQMWSLRKVSYNFLIHRDEGASCPAEILLSSSQPRQAGLSTSSHSKNHLCQIHQSRVETSFLDEKSSSSWLTCI